MWSCDELRVTDICMLSAVFLIELSRYHPVKSSLTGQILERLIIWNICVWAMVTGHVVWPCCIL